MGMEFSWNIQAVSAYMLCFTPLKNIYAYVKASMDIESGVLKGIVGIGKSDNR